MSPGGPLCHFPSFISEVSTSKIGPGIRCPGHPINQNVEPEGTIRECCENVYKHLHTLDLSLDPRPFVTLVVISLSPNFLIYKLG
jgi:hypothetical protein